MQDPIVGIDLGTSNCSVALVNDAGQAVVLPDWKGRKVIPSTISFHPNGDVLAGYEAKQRRITDPKNTVFSFKRILGRRFSSKEVAAAITRTPYQLKEGDNEQPIIVTRAGEFTVPEVSAIMLHHMRQVAKRALGTEVRRAVVTVPANFTDAQRQATALAGEIAELVVVRILNEPTAAALAYAHGRQLSQTVAVYDFGGGTFDVTVLRLHDNVYEVLATAGDTFLGGDDIDSRLVDHMVQEFLHRHRIDLKTDEQVVQRLRALAEQVKCELSTKNRAVVTAEGVAVGAGGAPLDLHFSLLRDKLVELTADIVDRSFPVCDEALKLAGLRAGQLDEVVLVGGTTKMPYVRDRVAAYFGQAPRTDVDPDQAVALGAAISGSGLAALLDKRVTIAPKAAPAAKAPKPPPLPAGVAPTPPPSRADALAQIYADALAAVSEDEEPTGIGGPRALPLPAPAEAKAGISFPPLPAPEEPPPLAEVSFPKPLPVLVEVTPRALAIATVSGYCDQVVRRNAQIPCEKSREFITAKDNQEAVEIKICQGESRRFADNTPLGTLVLDGLPPRPRGEVKIVVTFGINTDGILEVRAQDGKTGKAQSVRLSLLGVDTEDLVESREKFKGLRTSDAG